MPPGQQKFVPVNKRQRTGAVVSRKEAIAEDGETAEYYSEEVRFAGQWVEIAGRADCSSADKKGKLSYL